MQTSGSDGRWDEGSTLFRRGWVATSYPTSSDALEGWASVPGTEWELRAHPALGWATAQDAGHAVVMLGDVVDLDRSGSTDRRAIAKRALALLRRSIDQAVRYVAYLGGHFACLLVTPGQTVVMPDCAGTMPIFWHENGGRLTLGSHSHLIGELSHAPVDETAVGLLPRAREMKTGGTLYYPGILTPFVGVRPVIPNNLLRVQGEQITHERFYPFGDLELIRDPEEAYDAFSSVFTTHVRGLASLGNVCLSLTAGRDSQASFAAVLRTVRPGALLTWSYYNFSKPHEGLQADLLAANELARSFGVPHQVVALGETADREFSELYDRTMRYTPQFKALAQAIHDQLSPDLVEMQSMVAEAGTGFYKNRTEPRPSIERLARLYSRSEFGALPEVRDAFEEFIDYANFDDDAFGAIDYHDLFYWESRVGRWGCLRMQEVDLSVRIALPFNSRKVIEALMAPKFEDRVQKQALVRYASETLASVRRAAARKGLRGLADRVLSPR